MKVQATSCAALIRNIPCLQFPSCHVSFKHVLSVKRLKFGCSSTQSPTVFHMITPQAEVHFWLLVVARASVLRAAVLPRTSSLLEEIIKVKRTGRTWV